MRRAGGDRLLQPDHRRVQSAAEEHDRRHHDVHDPDLLGIGRSEPFLPEPRPSLVVRDDRRDRNEADDDGRRAADGEPLVRKRAPRKIA